MRIDERIMILALIHSLNTINKQINKQTQATVSLHTQLYEQLHVNLQYNIYLEINTANILSSLTITDLCKLHYSYKRVQFSIISKLPGYLQTAEIYRHQNTRNITELDEKHTQNKTRATVIPPLHC